MATRWPRSTSSAWKAQEANQSALEGGEFHCVDVVVLKSKNEHQTQSSNKNCTSTYVDSNSSGRSQRGSIKRHLRGAAYGDHGEMDTVISVTSMAVVIGNDYC